MGVWICLAMKAGAAETNYRMKEGRKYDFKSDFTDNR